ncbi:MAG: hypothetical protein NC405_02195 [Odoribacter sp.]|nr:hypothetical protein [Odoribacter sp.]
MLKYSLLAVALATFNYSGAQIVTTDAYSWHGDTITQGEYTAYSPDGISLISTYSAQPGYFMPVNKEWHLSRDISMYPQLKTPNKLHTAIYNLGLEEMINAVEPDTTLRTGKEWAGVWTRDVSYSIILSMAYLQPLASEISLRHKVTPTGRIIQDTGSGGAWPVSSDRMIWAVAAYELYKVTGDRQWLEYIYPVIRNSMEDDLLMTHNTDSGLVKGETSFIDWREQSYPKWMQTADIYQSEALGTSAVHAITLDILAEIAADLGLNDDAERYSKLAGELTEAINTHLWMPDKGYYAMYNYGREFPVINPRAETLGEALTILYDIAPADRARAITENNPTTPFGAAIFFPQIADMPAYHNNALWPWVASYWAMANAKAGNEQGTLEAIGSVFRPAALFTTNKENFVLDNGDIATELNSSNMLWCLAGNLAITHRILFGINYEKDGLVFKPFVPEALAADRTLEGFRYRDATLDITVKGYGDHIASFTLNGRNHKPKIPADIKGHNTIVITMDNKPIPPMSVNHTPNIKAPLTPIATLSNSPELDAPGVPANNLLQWQPIEYIAGYIVLRDGVAIDTVRTTSYPATVPGAYQVVGFSDKGVQSFASAPVDNFPVTTYEMPHESIMITSPEVSYRPDTPVNGFHGNGFVEIDHASAPVIVEIEVDSDGIYAVETIYANGNGPVNTENKCAIRTLEVDGAPAGKLIMPHRGVANWNDWGHSNPVMIPLSAGRHKLSITFRPEDENMNLHTNHALIDRITVKKIK